MFQQYFSLWGMSLAAISVASIAYISRKRRYSITWSELISVFLIILIGSTVGPSLASLIVQGYANGKRAYGMVLLNTALLLSYTALRNNNDGRLTDFAAVAAAAVCCIGKLQCCFDHCCYGIVLFKTTAGDLVRFPSEILEEISLLAILLWLIVLEQKGKSNGFLWALHVLWYGITRYIADLFRANPKELKVFLFGMRPGQFWSIIIVLVGLWLLGKAFKNKYGRALEGHELLQAIIGKFPEI